VSFQDTNKALTQKYLDMAIGLPTAYESVTFDPPKTGDWASLYILPAINAPVTLGVGGEDSEFGILQIDFYTEPGHSTDKLLTWANTVQTNMVAGMSFIYGITTVWIVSVERTPIRPDGGWMRLTLNVNWESRFVRPAF
jgi:hypothetical protein